MFCDVSRSFHRYHSNAMHVSVVLVEARNGGYRWNQSAVNFSHAHDLEHRVHSYGLLPL